MRSPKNMSLLIDKFCDFHGAALKLGQVMSMQNPKTVHCLQISDLALNTTNES